MILHHKCPNCGSDMVYDADSGKLACHSCRERFDISRFDGQPRPQPAASGTVTYHCDNCGADLMALPETAATTCGYCGAGVVLAERVSGSQAPHYVIPFSISKEQAIEAFKKWCRNGLLTPTDFKLADRIKSITGVYVPFWLYDVNARVTVSAVCSNTRKYTSGDFNVTEIDFYDVYRELDLHYVKVPVDSSVKMDDELMDRLEPFNYDELKAFQPAYLSGFTAEKYQIPDTDLLQRARDKIKAHIEEVTLSSISGYDRIESVVEDHDMRNVSSHYVLLPVWLIAYDWDKAEHNFFMNGQTGKVVGTPPNSFLKVTALFSGIAACAFLALKGLAYANGGVFW